MTDDDDYSSYSFGECVTCTCPSGDPVCGTDGVSYESNCHLNSCYEGAQAPTIACGGRCFDYFNNDGCGIPEVCDEVCGIYGDVDDAFAQTETFPNAEAAECLGYDIYYPMGCGQCDPSSAYCNVDDPVCGYGAEGEKTYQNYCDLNCNGGGVKIHSGACEGDGECQAAACETESGPPVCGNDGIQYENSCYAETCGLLDAGEYSTGPCDCDCDNTWDPVCDTTGITHANSCMLECWGATQAEDGVCLSCALHIATFEEKAVCGNDGMTYPTSEIFESSECNGCENPPCHSKNACETCETDADCNDLNPNTTDSCFGSTCVFL